MVSRLRWLLFAVAALLSPLAAQDDPKFRLTASFKPASASPGDAVKLVLEATTEPGWHAYGTMETSNMPVSLDTSSLKLTGLELAGDVAIPTGRAHVTPTGTQFPMPETFEVVVPLKVSAGATAMKVSGALGYQICDEAMCERPSEASFVASLKLAVGGGVAAQNPGTKPVVPMPKLGTAPGLMLEPDEKVTIRASFEPETARAGEVATLVLDVHVIDGWHAYGTSEGVNIPVAFDPLDQDLGDLAFEGEAVIPPGDAFETPTGPQYPLPHDFQVRQAVRVPVGTEAGEIEVDGILNYQICNDTGFCERPAEGEYDAVLVVEAGDARAERMDAPKPVVPEKPVEPASTDSSEEDDNPFGGSWWALIIACIGGGLFALAMPCTYPMIPITFSFFTKQAEKRGGNVLPLTIAYGLGIIVMFVSVGVLLSTVIIDVVNHWVTNTVIGLMFFFFAFVLFGWINLNPPQWMNKLAYKAQGSAASTSGSGGMGGALIGVFFMGATLVITSFTCTAPIVGSLIANVAKFGNTRVAIGMAVFGLTMAIPFMALSLAPGKVKAMPKSGEWMDTLKISLGFVELAAAFKFVSMVDFAMGWQILPRELFLMLWGTTFIMWAMYLFGILRKAGKPIEGVSNGRMAGGMLVSFLATYFMFGAMGNKLDVILTGFIPGYSNSIVVHSEGASAASDKHIYIKDDPERAIARAIKDDKLLLYNFTGFN